MIGYFQYRAGTGGYFFIRALLYRYGYTDKPTPSSYWNEYHIPAEYSFPNFKKIPWHDTYGHKWYNWETGIGSTYKSERVKTCRAIKVYRLMWPHSCSVSQNFAIACVPSLEPHFCVCSQSSSSFATADMVFRLSFAVPPFVCSRRDGHCPVP